MKREGQVLWSGLALALLAVAAPALAQDTDRPASVLIYPLFDSSGGTGTVVCVTNTNANRSYCPTEDHRVGDVLLHYLYIDGEDCGEFDRYEYLTPGDTLCVIASEHNPDSDRGYLVVTALDPDDEALLGFDHLVGSAIVVESDLNFLWSYRAVGMQTGYVVEDCLDVRNPDAFPGDQDGVPDYDGVEYSKFPEKLILDSFFEEGGPHRFTSRLTLLATSGPSYENETQFTIWNNAETKYSRSFKFTCWWSGPLSDISAIVADLGGDEGEIGHQTENGWIEIAGSRILDLAGNPLKRADGVRNATPALLGVFMQGIESTPFAYGHGLHMVGALDGMEIDLGDGDPQGD